MRPWVHTTRTLRHIPTLCHAWCTSAAAGPQADRVHACRSSSCGGLWLPRVRMAACVRHRRRERAMAAVAVVEFGVLDDAPNTSCGGMASGVTVNHSYGCSLHAHGV